MAGMAKSKRAKSRAKARAERLAQVLLLVMAAFGQEAPDCRNVPVAPDGVPIPARSELFLMRRSKINFSASAPGIGKFSGKGNIFVTTLRLVFVNEGLDGEFSSFDIPLSTTDREKFNQPIFGANNLTGTCVSLRGTVWNWKITFKSGGCGTFLPVYLMMMAEVRQNRPAGGGAEAGPWGPGQRLTDAIAMGTFQQQAYVDANDPSVIYVAQPVVEAPQGVVPGQAVPVATVGEGKLPDNIPVASQAM